MTKARCPIEEYCVKKGIECKFYPWCKNKLKPHCRAKPKKDETTNVSKV